MIAFGHIDARWPAVFIRVVTFVTALQKATDVSDGYLAALRHGSRADDSVFDLDSGCHCKALTEP